MHRTIRLTDYRTNGLDHCFSTFSVKRNPLQQFRLLMEPMSFGDGWPKFETEGREWVLAEGQRAPPHHVKGLGSAVSSSSGVRGIVQTTNTFWTY